MKRIKPHNVQSALQQFHLLAVFFENILIRVDTVNIWLRFGTGGLIMAEYIEKAAALSIHEPSKSNRYYQTDNLDVWQSHKPDDFCSYGERKEGAD